MQIEFRCRTFDEILVKRIQKRRWNKNNKVITQKMILKFASRGVPENFLWEFFSTSCAQDLPTLHDAGFWAGRLGGIQLPAFIEAIRLILMPECISEIFFPAAQVGGSVVTVIKLNHAT